MTDRELLKAAAKAAGLVIDKSPCNGGGAGNDGFDILGNAMLDWHNNKTWNPLTDDGDALRLAVKLRIAVDPWGAGACARRVCQSERFRFQEEVRHFEHMSHWLEQKMIGI